MWIEIYVIEFLIPSVGSPSARKVWIEMLIFTASLVGLVGRLPQGRCGLKYSGVFP